MIKINNSTSENKPPWLLGELSGPTRTSPSGAPAGAVPAAAPSDTWTRLRRGLVAAARAVPLAGRVLLSWLAALPRRLGDRLFAMNDAEAYWRSWQITRTHGGLGRRYHDPRFGLAQPLGGGQPAPADGAGSAAPAPSVPPSPSATAGAAVRTERASN